MSAVHELQIARARRGRPARSAAGTTAAADGKEQVVAIFGLFGCGNLGNDASLESMLMFLREKLPGARLFCICKSPQVVTDTFGIEAVPIRIEKGEGSKHLLRRILLKGPGKAMDFFRAFRLVRKADIMIVPGTGILDDFGEAPTGMPFEVSKWCLAARLAGTRIAFISIGAGPIRRRVSRWLMTGAARMADYRSYRDAASRKFMESAGVDTSHDPGYPDLAFRLPVPEPRETDPSRPLNVGVGVMNYRGWYGFEERGQIVLDAYVARMAMFVSHLLASGYDVRLLTGDEDDAPAVEALLAALSEKDAQKLSYEPVHSLHDVLRQVARTDLVVASRFHNVVAALMTGKPVISLSYAVKNDQLLAEMDLSDYCLNVENFDVGVLLRQLSMLAVRRDEYSRTIRSRVGQFRESLELQDEFLLSTLL